VGSTIFEKFLMRVTVKFSENELGIGSPKTNFINKAARISYQHQGSTTA
jgi:hypothetical protein